MLTALSIIEARVAGEKQNAIDVAWNIGGNSQGWSEASLKNQVNIAKSRAKDKGLFNVRLLGYWKTKNPSGDEAAWLDAVLVAKLPTDDPQIIVGVAFFFDVDLESDDEALEKINDETEHVIEKVKRNQTYFSYRGSYILGEFEKV